MISKPDLISLYLQSGSLFLHFDPRHVEVMVPDGYKSRVEMCLQIGYNLPHPIKHLSYNHEGLYGVFLFGGEESPCYVPMAAVFAVVHQDGRGHLYRESLSTDYVDALVEKSRVARLPSTNFRRPDGVLDLSAYREFKRGR